MLPRRVRATFVATRAIVRELMPTLMPMAGLDPNSHKVDQAGRSHKKPRSEG